MASYSDITNTLNFSVALKPTSAFPLDARTMFGSYAAAAAAAKTAENAGSTNTIYYYGQTLTVFENDVATQFLIQGDGTLKEVGATVATDDKTIVLEDNTLSLKDFGKKYYEYHHADTVIATGDYTYPDNMPTADEGSYVQIANQWYLKGADAWATTDQTPKTSAYYILKEGWKSGLEPKVIGDQVSGFSLAWYEPSATTVEGLSSSISTLQKSIEGIDANVKKNTDAINVLNGESTVDGSVKKQVNDAIAAVVAGAPEDFDTLKEMSDWISTHENTAAEMNTSILANKTAIAALEKLVGTLPEGTKATTVIGYIAEAIKVETDRATAAEDALGKRIDTLDGGVVKKVEKSDTNGNIKVDGTEVEVYSMPIMSTEVAGGAKVDGTSLEVSETGVLGIKAVDAAKVTGLDNKIAEAKTDISDTTKNYVNENAVAKTSIVSSDTIADSTETASKEKVISEEALLDALTWKTTM